jgi:Cu(I)-responsive transcriptional regulator
MRIGEAAQRSGVRAKTIRYYENSGLIDSAVRGDNGYRDYSDNDVEILRFIHRARRLGFAIKDVARLLALWGDNRRSSSDVKALATEQLVDIEERITELQSIRDTLLHLVGCCHGDERPECPILDQLAAPN